MKEIIFLVEDYRKRKDILKRTWSDLEWDGGNPNSGTWSNENIEIHVKWNKNPAEIHYKGPKDTSTFKRLEKISNKFGFEMYEKGEIPDSIKEDLIGIMELTTRPPGKGKPPESIIDHMEKWYIDDIVEVGREFLDRKGIDEDMVDLESIARDIFEKRKEEGVNLW